ncbi:MAG TPA: hypothetical protein ENN80_01240 [Candidatus Hydrogenedentes bacterium]|nr:hypothetical protein [Candidatus Hydrogenedentota bacterium]
MRDDIAVHKDFHGALSFGLEFLEEQYGLDGMRAFLEGLAHTVYAPLVADLRERGLDALEEHWRAVFTIEGGDFELAMEGDVLILNVRRCPAIAHMREHRYAIAPHFCEHTRFVNDAICRAAGYASSVECDPEAGACVQKFWKDGGRQGA